MSDSKSDSKMDDMIKNSIDGIKDFWKNDGAVGNPIVTPSGVTVIPVSKVSVAFASGSVDFGGKVMSKQNFGGGQGSGITVTPVAFLTVSPNSDINLINIGGGNSNVQKIVSLIEDAPQIIEKIKKSLS